MDKKLILSALIMLVVVPAALADIRVDEVKAYVNNVKQSDIDIDGGTVTAYPNDIVDFTIDLENTKNITAKVKLKLTVDELDKSGDIVKDQSWYDIEKFDVRSKMLSFTVPDIATTGDYDIYLKYTFKYNDTEIERQIDYDLRVRRSTTTTTVTLQDYFANMTITCRDMIKNMYVGIGFVGKYNNCSEDLSTVKEDRGKCKSDLENCQQSLQKCNNDAVAKEQDTTACEQQVNNVKASMIDLNACQTQKDAAVKDAEKSKDYIIMALIAGGAGLYYWTNKKKNKMTVKDTYYYEKK